MKIDVPIEVMDERCLKCNALDIQVNGTRDLWAGLELVSREFDIQCSHLKLCKWLRKRYEEDKARDK